MSESSASAHTQHADAPTTLTTTTSPDVPTGTPYGNVPKPRYSVSRQSVCIPCARNKMKCNRQAPLCGRCQYLGRQCTWPTKSQSSRKRPRTGTRHGTSPSPSPFPMLHEGSEGVISGAKLVNRAEGAVGSLPDLPLVPPFAEAPLEPPFGGACRLGGRLSPSLSSEDELDFTQLDLLCPIDGESICARWLKPFLSDTVTKEYPPGVRKMISRMLTSYGTMAMRGDAPPFLHPTLLSHSSMQPVRTALSLVRACAPPAIGEKVITEAMEGVPSSDPDPVARVAALEAYLIYMLVLLHMGPESHSQRQVGMANLERLASLASPNLLCGGERTLRPPRWEEWLVAESTRRALYTLYLLDNLLSMHDGLPTFLGNELTGLPLPSAGRLWAATDRIAWQREYNTFLARWGDGPPCIQELWPGGLEERVDRYLGEGPDALGVFLFAVTCGTAVH